VEIGLKNFFTYELEVVEGGGGQGEIGKSKIQKKENNRLMGMEKNRKGKEDRAEDTAFWVGNRSSRGKRKKRIWVFTSIWGINRNLTVPKKK